MMASANVFQQFLRPARSVADYRADMDEADMRQAQLMGAAQQRQMREFEFAQAQEAARENALTRAAYARTVAESPDEETLLSRLERSGNMGLAKEAAARRKAALDAKQAQANIGKAEQETAASKADQARKKMADDIANIMSMADPASARAQLQAATGMDEGVRARLLASVPDDPQQFGEWQMRLIMARASADAQAHARAKAAQPAPPKTREVKMSDGTIRTQEWDAATGAFRDIPGAEAAPRRPGRAPGGGGGGGVGGGGGGAQAPTNDRASLSAQLGVPVAERDPWAGQDKKAADITKRQVYSSADKTLKAVGEDAARMRGMSQKMQRFLEVQGKEGLTMQGPVLGKAVAVTSAQQELDAIRDEITPQMRQPGSGATSDFDARMFRSATVGREKLPEANRAIAQAVMANAQNAQDREQFMRDYLTVNGHLDGAERHWKRYLEANPIFDPQSPQMPKINPNRAPYQQFFGNRQQAVPAAPTASPATPGTGGFRYLGKEN